MSSPHTHQSIDISLDQVTRTLARRIPLYRWRRPVYQTALLRSLGRIWQPSHRTVLDIGGGTGIIAQSIKELFKVDRVVSIDVHDRYLVGLDIQTQTYDGKTLPFADNSFDCVTLCNVVHHVPKERRAALLMECARVAKTRTIYIKDHMARSPLDHLRLRVLDGLGNVPFGGMVAAEYLGDADWLQLAEETGFRIAAREYETYRTGPMAYLFPNRLEVTMQWIARAPR